MIAVGRSNINDARPIGDNANWGKETISIFAPGQYILSTFPEYICQNHNQLFGDGTLMCEIDDFYRTTWLKRIQDGDYTLTQLLNNFNSCEQGQPSNYRSSKHNSNGYHYMTGSSMATPHVTGVAALLLSLNSNLTAIQLKTAIINSAKNIVIQVPNDYSGVLENQNAILLNAYNAVKYVLENYSQNIDLNGNTTNFSESIVSSNSPYYYQNNYLKLNVQSSFDYYFTVSSASPIEVTLYDSNFNYVTISQMISDYSIEKKFICNAMAAKVTLPSL
jgi:subtilisin family serine protease